MIKLYLDISDVIHGNEHTEHANMLNAHFKQKLLLGLRSPLNILKKCYRDGWITLVLNLLKSFVLVFVCV